MDRTTVERTVYLRDATVAELEVTLDQLGARGVSSNLDGPRWKLVTSGDVTIDIQILEDVNSWQMELVVENLAEWRAPFAGEGWEPTIAAMLLFDSTSRAASAVSRLVQDILTKHQGVASGVWTG